MAGGGGGCRDSLFLEALDRSQSKRDGGYKNNWSFEHVEESEGDAEKDEAKLLSIDDSDGSFSPSEEKKSLRCRSGTVGTSGECIKTYARRGKTGSFRVLKGNSVGLNMLGNSKKLSENTQNITCPGTIVHGRRFHHAHAQIPVVKTAAQRKEYPPHFQKIEIEPIRLLRPQLMESIMENTEESGSESDPEIKRKVQQKHHSSSCQSDLPLSPATKNCLAHLEVLEQTDYSENQTKYQSSGNDFYRDLQRRSKQTVTLSEPVESLLRSSIHQNSTAQKSPGTGLNTQKFYGPAAGKGSVDALSRDITGHSMLRLNGKVGLLTGTKIPKSSGNLRPRNTRPSELNDPIILSSDDEEDEDSGSTSRMESTSPRPADSARSSPAPSTGKVEAALKENSSGIEQRLHSVAPDTEIGITLPRKARMKDQFGNIVSNTPVKRRKVSSQEVTDAVPINYQNSWESVILHCRSIRIGTLRRMVVEPVIFCLDFIKIRLEESESDTREINLKTSELTKCEWCSVRKLPVVFLQTVPAACLSLRSQLKMSREKDNVWYDCKGVNPEEQYIVLIFETGLDAHGNTIFEKIVAEIGLRNNISDFFVKIPFEEANGRLVAFTKSLEDNSKGSCSHKENKIKNVVSDSKMQLRNAPPFQFFDDDDDEIGEPHTVFIGPIEKLIVYPPPPAKGGISVTNEDLHCLNEGEFLNDVIIDFYLKYLVLEKLKKEDADRIHVFSSFFYKRLNQRERRNLHETANLSIQQKRHGRVKTWTRHVDIFEKDFIFVPLNEAAHWFLAVICFPGLEKPKYEPNPHYHESAPMQIKAFSSERESNTPSPLPNELVSSSQSSPSKATVKKPLNKKLPAALTDTNSETEDSGPLYCRRSPCRGKSGFKKINQIDSDSEEPKTVQSACHKLDHRTSDENGIQSEYLTAVQPMDGLHKIRLSYSEDSTDGSKLNEDELIDFSEDQDNQEDSSDDGGLVDDNCNSELGQWHLKPNICIQPCILLMDSLRGPSRSNVVKILREYLEVEWEVRKGSKRSFSKDVMKGSNPKVPQQNNFSDCGVYVLQYVESFFENPILNFELPMNLTDWFPRPRMKTKREEIRNIILKLQEQQNKEKRGQKDLSSTEGSLQEGTEQFINNSSD
ncbi:sentrin-specific protease 6 isoform X3 [Pelodiscus sinensis]|uniref:Sentrin-specific protease 6 n=1 Tax=Pelodiscus sinensis TaxID=13735 RepID=K7G3I3_PELSI|nr:sentrin-specific protease 6 isoform X2 [Pelodiscus sinensis]|eukprot:XP_006132020.1 sentrin-specific protease 6 isoform X2 [Pelodiscus sinensis]